MDVKATHKELTDTSYELKIQIPFEDLDKKYKEVSKEVSKDIQLPGFRKGKVPQNVIESKFRGHIEEQTLQKIIPEAYSSAIEQTKLEVFGTPIAKEISPFKENTPLDVTFEVEKNPEVIIKKYKIKVKENTYNFDFDGLYADEEYRTLRSKAEMKEVKTSIKKDYFVKANIVDQTKLDGQDRSIKECPIELKDNKTAPFELDSDLIGLKQGDKKVIEKKLSKDYEEEDIAGKTLKLEVEIISVKEIILPTLTEELAKELNFESIKNFKESIKERMDSYVEKFRKTQNYMSVIDSLKKEAQFTLPNSLISSAIDYNLNNLKAQLGGDDKMFNQFLMAQGMSIEKLKADLRPKSIEELKNQLLTERILEDKKIEVEEEELKKELEKIAKQYNKEYKDMRKELIQSGQYTQIRDNMLREKAVLSVFGEATKEKGKVFTNKDIL